MRSERCLIDTTYLLAASGRITEVKVTMPTDELTFYVQPSLTETTVTEWTGWAVPAPGIGQNWNGDNVFASLSVIAQVPIAGSSPVLIADQTRSLYPMQVLTDWLTAPTTAVSYNGTIVGKSGGINSLTRPAVAAGVASAVTGAVAFASGRTGTPGTNVVGNQGALAAGFRA
jgi:hypothetical protein